jgi:pimeloyl-ACP methyl ester carboxylesterase
VTRCPTTIAGRQSARGPIGSDGDMNQSVTSLPPKEFTTARVADWTEVDGQRVATVGRADARRQVLLFMGFLACVEPFELQRFAVLAAEWDAQVTVVDTPGCGYGGARLTKTERRACRRGDFTPIARRMVHSAQLQHHRLRRGPVTVVGYSMGASLAAAAAADPGLLRVSNMILVEPVAMRRWNLLGLLNSVRDEDRVIDEYLDRNVAFPDAVPPSDRRNEPPPSTFRLDLAHLGFALSRGQLAPDLLRANAIQQFSVQVVHGVRSRLSRSAVVERLIKVCRRAGMEMEDVPVGGRHALWHSLPDVAALARLTRKQWRR